VSDNAHPFDQGSQVQYGPDGVLYVSYEATSPLFGYTTDAMVVARSTDDGATFQTKELARVFDDSDCYPVFAGRQTLTDMHFRLNSYPSMSVDPLTGEISIAWTDQQGSGTCGTGASSFTGTTSNQVKLIHAPWATIQSAAVTHVASSAQDKVFPAVASRGGKIVVSYYTRDYGITSAAPVCNLQTNPVPTGITPVPTSRSVCMDYAATSSTTGFGSQMRLSSQSSNPFVQFADGSFIGDYSQIAMDTNGKAHASWTDFRGNPGHTPANQDVLIANFNP
jgi:ribosomal protein L31